MRHNIYSILLAAAAICALPSCDKEAVFSIKPGEGQLNCDALSVDYVNRGINSRATEIEVGDFTVNFVNTASNETARSFKYSEMPEIVALPVGSYRAEAEYGDNPIAEWEDPYYTGNSSFNIEDGKVTNNVDPIECTLSNIKVTVKVTDLGQDLLGDDIKVIVSAGEEGELTYDSSTNDKAGYFRCVTGSKTLIAEFTGTVDGVEVDQIVTYDDVAEGNSYSLNFQVNRPDNMNPGSIKITDNVTLDATVTIVNETKKIDPNEPDEDTIKDDMRPTEGNPGEDPNTGNEPGTDPGTDPGDETQGPKITPTSPGLKFGEAYTLVDAASTPVAFKVTSNTGITEFTIVIESDKLTPDELAEVGLSAKLDLVNPGDLAGALSGLGFKNGPEVDGQTDCNFDISNFVPMMIALGACDHKFHLTVSDAEGTTEKTLWLRCK